MPVQEESVPGTNCSKTSAASTMHRALSYLVLYGEYDYEAPKLLKISEDNATARVVGLLPENAGRDYEIRRHPSGDYFVYSGTLNYTEWCDDLSVIHLEAQGADGAPSSMPPSERLAGGCPVSRNLHPTLSREAAPGNDARLISYLLGFAV